MIVGAVVVPPAVHLRLDLADRFDRHRPVADRLPPVEQHHRRRLALETSSPRARPGSSASRVGGLVSADRQLRADRRLASCSSRSSSGAPGVDATRTTSLPWFLFTAHPVRRRDDRSSRSTSRAARSSTRRSGWRRTPTSSRLEGVAALVARHRPPPAGLGPGPARSRSSPGSSSGSSSRPAVLFAPVVQAGWDAAAAPRRALATELDRSGVPADDRLMSIDAGGFKYFTGRARRRLAGRPHRHDPRRRQGLRHPLAGPRARRRRSRRCGRSSSGDERPAWIGAPVFDVPATGRSGGPDLALYPVCFDPADARCGTARRDAAAKPGSRRPASSSSPLVARVVVASLRSPSRNPRTPPITSGVARNLLEGRGLVSDALWSFGTPPLVFPRPAFEVWLPLPTFLAAIPMAVLGRDVQRGAGLVGGHRVGRAGPGLAPRRGCRRGTRTCHGPGRGRWPSAPA